MLTIFWLFAATLIGRDRALVFLDQLLPTRLFPRVEKILLSQQSSRHILTASL